jgi:AsmA protein
MLKWGLIAAGVLLVLVIGALAAVPFLINTPLIQAHVAAAASHALGRPVTFASFSVSVFPLPSVRLRELQVAEDPRFGPAPFLTVEEGRVGLRLLPLLSGRVELTSLKLAKPQIELVADRGRWNIANLGAAPAGARGAARAGGGAPGGAAGTVLISRVEIDKGVIRYHRVGVKGSEFRLEDVNLTVSGIGLGESVQLKGEAVGNPGAVRIKISDATVPLAANRSANDAPVKATLDLDAKDVGGVIGAFGGAVLSSPALEGSAKGKLQVGGTLSRPTLNGELRLDGSGLQLKISDGSLALADGLALAEAPLRATVAVDARDVAPLGAAVIKSPALAGAVKGRLQMGGTLSRLTATGELELSRLTLSETRPRCPAPKQRQLALQDLRVPVAYTPARLESAPLHTKVAGGTLSVRLGVGLQPAQVITLGEMSLRGIQLAPVLVDYLCQGYAVTGPMDMTGEASMRSADPYRTMNGSGQLRIGPGKVVGADALALLGDVARLAGVLSEVLRPDPRMPSLASPLDFSSITATYRIVNGVLSAQDFLYQSPTMSAAAAGTYGLADTRVDLDVTVSQGRTQVKGKITGTLTPRSLRIVPTGLQRGDKDVIKKLLERLTR